MYHTSQSRSSKVMVVPLLVVEGPAAQLVREPLLVDTLVVPLLIRGASCANHHKAAHHGVLVAHC